MMENEMREQLEAQYEMPIGRLMYHFYWEEDMSAGAIGQEVEAPRQTVVYWLQQSGIKMRSRTLSDIQKLLMVAYIDAGMGDRAIASKLGCGRMTVKRYRNDMIVSGRPVDLERPLTPDDNDILAGIIAEMSEEDVISGEQSSS